MITKTCLAILCAAAAMAQTNTGSISGVVVDGATGTPVANATIYVDRNQKMGKQLTADSSGRYSVPDLPPGSHTVTAEAPSSPNAFPSYQRKLVTVASGQEIASVNFSLVIRGEISGRVVDQNKEPVAGASIFLIAREYTLGTLRHVYAAIAVSDDQGEYLLRNVEPGRAFLLMVARRQTILPAISDAPLDPKLRKQAFAATYYPGTPSAAGAQPLILRANERREGVDLRVLRTASYCAGGVLAGPSGPAPLTFTLADREPGSGKSGDGAVYLSNPRGETGPDGKIRLCGLYPGEHELVAYNKDVKGAPQFYGSTIIVVGDRDVENVSLTMQPQVAVPGEVVWEIDDPNAPAATGNLSINLSPVTRSQWGGESTDARTPVPGPFTFPQVLPDLHSTRLFGLPADAYVKEMTYAGHNVQHEAINPGTAMPGASLRIVLARDGATLSAKVADKDSNGIPDARVLVMPVSVASEAALAAQIVSGQCDQNGNWTSARLAPGKYYVMAMQTPHDNSPESIAKIWSNRNHMKEVELMPNGKAQLKLTILGTE